MKIDAEAATNTEKGNTGTTLNSSSSYFVLFFLVFSTAMAMALAIVAVFWQRNFLQFV